MAADLKSILALSMKIITVKVQSSSRSGEAPANKAFAGATAKKE